MNNRSKRMKEMTFGATLSRKRDFENIVKMLHNLKESREPERSNIRSKLNDWKSNVMDTNSVKRFLEDEGIPPSESRDELFERLVYCIWDDDVEPIADILSIDED